MRFKSLHEWLHWQETLHPKKIDLTLVRVRQVLSAMRLLPPPYAVITVAGTNGKGSTVALLTAMLQAGGYKVGSYTSPHILRYNERVAINSTPVDDDTLCRSFARIDAARGDVPLTYFEFGTVAAIDIFADSAVDIAVLEVGLGGRLDATNAVDADVAVIASVGIDHIAWLGDNREAIGVEKAGIFRSGRPAICGDPAPPTSVRQVAAEAGAQWQAINEHFGYRRQEAGWLWWSPGKQRGGLPLPALRGEVQLRNAATAIAALETLAERFPLSQAHIREGLQKVTIAGRFQVVTDVVTRIYDVAHNVDAATELANRLETMPWQGKTHAIFSMLGDKDIAGVVALLVKYVQHWHICEVESARAAGLASLHGALSLAGAGSITAYDDAAAAWQGVMAQAQPGERVIIFGSFYLVSAVMPMDPLLGMTA